MTPLHFGAKEGFNDVVNFLLTVDGINVNAKTNSGWTPLHMSAMKGHNGISTVLCSFEGAKIQEHDNKGNTPLHFAAAGGYTDIIGLLLSKGSDINGCNNEGMTPMHMAVKENKIEAVNFILDQHDYNVSLKNKDEMTAFDIASPEIRKIFIKKHPELEEKKELIKCRI